MSDHAISALISALPQPVLIINANERIQAANAGAQTLLGPNIEGRHFITALRQPEVIEGIENCLHDRATRKRRYLSAEQGHETSYDVTCSFVDIDTGGVLVSFLDITTMAQAGQMRRDFITNVSHELRTPLTSLLGFVETLKGPAKEDAKAAVRFLDMMHHEAERMVRLVQDLLSLNRVETDERVRPDTQVAVLPMIRAVVQLLTPLLERAQVTLNLQDNQIDKAIPGDEDQLQQVITNLVENAIRYGGAGKVVTVDLSLIDPHPDLREAAIVIAIQDQGPGIDAQHLPRLTERFYRIDSHRSREMGGTGLGLAIVKHILNRHRGRLRIESIPGEGSVFRVILPLN